MQYVGDDGGRVALPLHEGDEQVLDPGHGQETQARLQARQGLLPALEAGDHPGETRVCESVAEPAFAEHALVLQALRSESIKIKEAKPESESLQAIAFQHTPQVCSSVRMQQQ